MNLEDVLDPEYGLQQDEWSITSPRFGEDGQLEVVGFAGSRNHSKYYVVKCHTCAKDGELFKGGYFQSKKTSLVKGQIPCGCSKAPKWSKEQYAVLCSRKAEELGYKFTGFTGEWIGSRSKINMQCKEHGDWGSGVIFNLLFKGTTCPGCRHDYMKEVKKKPDPVMIESFFATGCFHPSTIFYRSSRKNNLGWRVYWSVSCPECGESGESTGSDLQKGCRPCACSRMRQQEAYINWIMDGSKVVAVKFGIANIAINRSKQQNASCVYEVRNYLVYKFPDVQSCKSAERACKLELDCGIISKNEMSDGYTETTFSYNVDKIKQIYSSHGGVCIFNSEDIK